MTSIQNLRFPLAVADISRAHSVRKWHLAAGVQALRCSVKLGKVVSWGQTDAGGVNKTSISPVLLISSLCLSRLDNGWWEQPVAADRERGEEHGVPQAGAPHFTPRPPPGDPLPAETMLRWGTSCCCYCVRCACVCVCLCDPNVYLMYVTNTKDLLNHLLMLYR